MFEKHAAIDTVELCGRWRIQRWPGGFCS